MIKLDTLIARFVHDVLQALRGATLAELSELFAAPNPRAPSLRAPAVVADNRRRRAPRSARAPERAPSSTRRRVPKPTTKTRPHVVVAEITDPEALLAATTPAAQPRSVRAPVAHEEEAPPPSGERLATDAGGRLRAGETLVRSSGSGVVIRRAKRS